MTEKGNPIWEVGHPGPVKHIIEVLVVRGENFKQDADLIGLFRPPQEFPSLVCHRGPKKLMSFIDFLDVSTLQTEDG